MAQFRFYITELFNGTVIGTNDLEEAQYLSEASEYFAVDTENGTYRVDGSDWTPVQPAQTFDETQDGG